MFTLKNFLIILTIFVVMVTGCATERYLPEINHPDVPAQKLNFPKAEYYNFVWLPLQGLTASILDYNSHQFNLAFENEKEFLTPVLPIDAACKRNMQYYPGNLLPDGRMAIIKDCYGNLNMNKEDTRLMMAYDFKNARLEQIVAGNLPNGILSKSFTWNPSMTHGVQELTDRLFSTLYWISPQGSSPIALTLSNGTKSWSLEEQFYNMTTSNEGGSQYGYAGYPAWSPDGKTIAFWASFDSMGYSGITRVDGEFYLVFLDPDTLVYHFAMKNVYDPASLVWSPNGKWLAFYGEVGSNNEHGLWIVSSNEPLKIYRIGREEYFNGSPVWSPDGSSIAVISCPNYEADVCETSEILKYDLDGILP